MYLKINIICLNIYIENKSNVFKNQYYLFEYLLYALVI